jgi:hypothetical protein
MRRISNFFRSAEVNKSELSTLDLAASQLQSQIDQKSTILFQGILSQSSGNPAEILGSYRSIIGTPAVTNPSTGNYTITFDQQLINGLYNNDGTDMLIVPAFVMTANDGARFVKADIGDDDKILLKFYDSTFSLADFGITGVSLLPIMLVRSGL